LSIPHFENDFFAPDNYTFAPLPIFMVLMVDAAMEKIESTMDVEVIGNRLQPYPYRGLKRNHSADAAGHNSKITLSLNDYANLVSKRILLNLLAPSSNDRVYGFHESHIAGTYHGISGSTENRLLIIN
jgi:hypothetical protein